MENEKGRCKSDFCSRICGLKDNMRTIPTTRHSLTTALIALVSHPFAAKLAQRMTSVISRGSREGSGRKLSRMQSLQRTISGASQIEVTPPKHCRDLGDAKFLAKTYRIENISHSVSAGRREGDGRRHEAGDAHERPRVVLDPARLRGRHGRRLRPAPHGHPLLRNARGMFAKSESPIFTPDSNGVSSTCVRLFDICRCSQFWILRNKKKKQIFTL